MWTVEFAAAAERDFELIFDHLLSAYEDFGDDFDTALDRAARRVEAMQASASSFVTAPYQGTLRADILDGLRFVRREKAVFWFIPDSDRETVQILAVFFGAQDHITHMLKRLLSRTED